MENPFDIIMKRLDILEAKIDKLAIGNIDPDIQLKPAQQELITGTELRKFLNISRSTETKYRRTGKLPFVWAGGQYRYDLEKVIEAISHKK